MANSYLEHHLALLQHLRNILGALGEAEQVPEENHGLFLERFDELMDELPRDPEGAQYLGQDLISRSSTAIRRSPTWYLATCCGSSAAIACTSCRTKRSTCSSASTSAATKPKSAAKRSTGTAKSSCSRCPRTARGTEPATATGRPAPTAIRALGAASRQPKPRYPFRIKTDRPPDCRSAPSPYLAVLPGSRSFTPLRRTRPH